MNDETEKMAGARPSKKRVRRYAIAPGAIIGAAVLLLIISWPGPLFWLIDRVYSEEGYRSPSDSITYRETRRAERTPRWSADGQAIIINDESQIIGVPVDGGDMFDVKGTGDKEQYSPSLSSEGRIAYQIGIDKGNWQYERQIAIASIYDDHLKIVTIDADAYPKPAYPTWSNDGNYIAFVTHFERDNPWLDRELNILKDDGSLLKNFPIQFSTAPNVILSEERPNTTARVVWSHDDRQIAYLGLQPTGPSHRLYRLSVIGAEGSNDRPVVQKWDLISLPAWSLTNDRLYFVHSERREGSWQAALYSIKPNGSDERFIVEVPGASVYEVTLSPDGTTLLIDGAYTVKTDGTELTPLNTQAPSYASWSPDGRRIAVYHIEEGGKGVLLRTMNADGSEPRTIFSAGE